MILTAPWLLLLGLLVAVPVWVHLRSRARPREVPFAAHEIARAAAPTDRRLSPPTDRALLVVRALAVLAAALAAAGPTCVRRSPVARADGVAVVLDDSASMRAPAPAARFDRARRAALRALDEHPGEAVAAALACAPDRVAAGPRDARALVAAARPGVAACDVVAAAASALRAVRSRGARRPALVVATDATRAASPAGLAALGSRAAAAGAALALPLGAAAAGGNVGVVDARYVRDAAGARVEAALGCYGAHGARYTARLVAGGRVLAEAAVACRHDDAAAFRLSLAAAPDEAAGEVAVAGGDAFPDDDRRAVLLRPPPRPAVVVVGTAPARGSAALAEALRSTERFVVREAPPSALAAPLDADALALVALDDADLPPGAADTLARFAGAVLVAGAVPRAASARAPVLRATRRTTPVALDPPREGPRALLPVRATAWWALAPRPGARVRWTAGGAPVLVTGGDDPRSAALGVPLDERESDLALRPAWVAVAAELVAWLAAPRAAASERRGATAWFVRRPGGAALGSVRGPGGAMVVVRAVAGGAVLEGVREPGVYRAGATPVLAVGIDAAESDLRPAALPRATLDAGAATARASWRARVAAAALALLAAEAWRRARG